MPLSDYPRVSLAHLPTPLEFLPRLTKHLGGPNVYVKRDDCTGLGTGGNKTRKLEFLMADAIKKKADLIITQGAVQSNHARQTAAAAAKIGMKCELVFEKRVADATTAYKESGNVFLDKLFGANIHEVANGSDMTKEMEDLSDQLREKGSNPYIIPGGGSNPIGALGYVDCVIELIAQAKSKDITFDSIIMATGSAGTQAGLVVGSKITKSNIPVLGVGVNAPKEAQEEKVFKLASDLSDFMGLPSLVSRDDIVANCDYVGDGYGIPTLGMNKALLQLARLEGLLFDPVYSGKGLAGMIDLIGKGYFENQKNIVFIHTGGAAGLFAYHDILET
ncbi:MAG: D-cysteine desulfhydrase [Gammaproteobacteria bacterium]|nr:MAG: D-cysteine desulfhydrase [Gammaproteobacteria bacterium]